MFQGVCMFCVHPGLFFLQFPSILQLSGGFKSCSSAERRRSARDLLVHPGRAAFILVHTSAQDRAGCKDERRLFELSNACRPPTSAVPSIKYERGPCCSATHFLDYLGASERDRRSSFQIGNKYLQHGAHMFTVLRGKT